MIITSSSNPQIKNLVKLRKRRTRDEQQLMLIEGYRPVLMALKNRVPALQLFVCPELYLGENEAKLIEQAATAGAQIIQTSAEVFKKIAYRDRPEGLLLLAEQFGGKLSDLRVPAEALFLVAVGIEKPGNLGTMMRSADAAGADGVIICDGRTDIYNPNTVRASIGTLFSMPFASTTSAEFFGWLRQHSIQLLSTTPDATQTLYESNMRSPIAIAIGTEQVGLPDEWLERADHKVLIPMYGQADSLNASAAAGLMLYEAVRQRHHSSV